MSRITKSTGVLTMALTGAVCLAGCSSSSSDGGASSPGTTSSVSGTTGTTPVTTGSAPSRSAASSSLPAHSDSTHSDSTHSDSPGSGATVSDPGADLATATFPVSMQRARRIAGTQLQGATMTELGLDFDRRIGRWVWKIDEQKGTTQRELKIDAGSGKVVGGETDEESDNPRAVDPQQMSPQDAAAKATALVPGTVAQWTLEYDDGVQRYDVEIRTGSDTQDVIVAVDTGKATRD